jgi:AraC family transcriptional regulator of adaptative response/methylated-DNA-[protein]-cysteine methyltransferase
MKTNSTSRAVRNFDRIAASIEYMSKSFGRQPSVAEIAATAGMSEYHFARVFRRWAGISPKQYLQRLSLEAAKHALRGDASVLQAALEAGLSGPGRLHDLFVVLEGVTPGEFKAGGRGLEIRFGRAESPFGTAVIAVTGRGVSYLGFADGDEDPEGWAEFRSSWPHATWIEDAASARAVATTIWGVASRGSTRQLKLWVHGSNFQIQVWQALLRRARDLTVNYSDIAREIGQPTAARAVGNAVGSNPVAWLIPCHHVLRANGGLGGYRWGVERKRAMLAWEVAQSVVSAS